MGAFDSVPRRNGNLLLTEDRRSSIIGKGIKKESVLMLDKNDLQMIQEMMLASEQRLFGKIEESEQRMTGKIEESENRMKVMMESYFDPKFNLLYENQQIMMEQLAPRSRVDDLEDEVKFLKSVVRQMNDDIQKLKKAM
jgi:archaellum component FlaC